MEQNFFINANSLTLHVKVDPVMLDGFPLIFINSLGSDLRIWDAMMDGFEFQNTCSVIRYDKRGHGLSDCPDAPYSIRDHTLDLMGLVDVLEFEQVVLVGISVGGMIAMDFASQYTDRVKALVLCDTFPKIGTEEMWNNRINTLRKHGMAHLGEAILARWFSPSFKANEPSAYQGYYNMLTRMPVAGYTSTCEAIRDADLTEAVKTITQPTLVICGAEDASTPPDLVKGLVDLMPNARYLEAPSAGHLPCIENPMFMTSRIQHFMSEVL